MSAERWIIGIVRVVVAMAALAIAALPAYAGAWAACHDGSYWCGTTADVKTAIAYLAIAGAIVGLGASLLFVRDGLRVVLAFVLGGVAVGIVAAVVLSST